MLGAVSYHKYVFNSKYAKKKKGPLLLIYVDFHPHSCPLSSPDILAHVIVVHASRCGRRPHMWSKWDFIPARKLSH